MDHDWLVAFHKAKLERILVPCQENRNTFQDSGIELPIDILRGGTDPEEFPLIRRWPELKRPYTFFTLGDRGMRKGWEEVWKAFYIAFGGKTTGNMDARLVIKYLPQAALADSIDKMKEAEGADKRITYLRQNVKSLAEIFETIDCVVLPSHFEGWGMPHREAAMMGLPVITTKYSGLDDGFTERWALVVDHKMHESGLWCTADVEDLAQKMKYCFYSPETAMGFGRKASQWLQENQTWDHAAQRLLEMINGLGMERPTWELAQARLEGILHS
jgi:glycosyltransferase involved in cell wall biosynthesis